VSRIDLPRARRVQWLAFFGGLLVGIACWRWYVLRGHGEPVGVDFGNWLTLGNAIGGAHVSATDTVYPPVVPLMSRAAVAIFGMPEATFVLAALAGVCPAVGVWIATRRSVGEPWAVVGGLTLGVAAATSAAAAWGGEPQLIGLGLAPLVAVAGSRLVARPSAERAVVLGVGLLALGLVSPLVFGLAVVALVVILAIATGLAGSVRWLRYAPLSAVCVAPALPVLWRYVSTATVDVTAANAATGGGLLRAGFVGPSAVWAILGALALVAPFVTWRQRRDPLWAASTGLTVVALASVVVAKDARYMSLAPTAAVIGALMVAAHGVHGVRALGAVLLVGAAAWALVAGPTLMAHERDAYARFVPRGTGAAIEWVRRHTGTHDVFVVAPVAGVPTGWLVEGWGHRTSYVGSAPMWLEFPGERRRAQLATAVLTGPSWPQDAAFARSRRLGARWIYLPTGWRGVDRQALRHEEATHPGLVAYDGPGALVLRVPAATVGGGRAQ
jgi:hypothetical protein